MWGWHFYTDRNHTDELLEVYNRLVDFSKGKIILKVDETGSVFLPDMSSLYQMAQVFYEEDEDKDNKSKKHKNKEKVKYIYVEEPSLELFCEVFNYDILNLPNEVLNLTVEQRTKMLEEKRAGQFDLKNETFEKYQNGINCLKWFIEGKEIEYFSSDYPLQGRYNKHTGRWEYQGEWKDFGDHLSLSSSFGEVKYRLKERKVRDWA